MLVLPQLQRRLDQGIAVAEVPVEAALGGPEALGDGLDGNRSEPALTNRGERGGGPVGRCQPAGSGGGITLGTHASVR